MTPLDRLRLEKAAADCGFEMTPVVHDDAVEMRSARFPEIVRVASVGGQRFAVSASDPTILGLAPGLAARHIEGFASLYGLLRETAAHARTKPDRVADQFKAQTSAMPRSTEAERWVVQRVGQGLFRAALLDYWQGRCCVTGLDVPDLLRASHIRPWSKCDNDEQRLDVFNGLLLAPHLDALFDGGWMTVSDGGELLWSPQLPEIACNLLGLPPELRLDGLRPEHLPYLAFHRSAVWRR